VAACIHAHLFVGPSPKRLAAGFSLHVVHVESSGLSGESACAELGGGRSGWLPPNSQLHVRIFDEIRPGLAAPVLLISGLVPPRRSSGCRDLCALGCRRGTRRAETPCDVPLVSPSKRIGAGCPRGAIVRLHGYCAILCRSAVVRGGAPKQWILASLLGPPRLRWGLFARVPPFLAARRRGGPFSRALKGPDHALEPAHAATAPSSNVPGSQEGRWSVTSAHVRQCFVNAAFAWTYTVPLAAAGRGWRAAAVGAALSARGLGAVRAGLRAEL
jgi:hypothetical protein